MKINNPDSFREHQNNQDETQIIVEKKGFFSKYCSCIVFSNQNLQNQKVQPQKLDDYNSVNQLDQDQSIGNEVRKLINDSAKLKEENSKLIIVNQEILQQNEQLKSKLQLLDEENNKMKEEIINLKSQENKNQRENQVILLEKQKQIQMLKKDLILAEQQNKKLTNMQEQDSIEKQKALKNVQEFQQEIIKLSQQCEEKNQVNQQLKFENQQKEKKIEDLLLNEKKIEQISNKTQEQQWMISFNFKECGTEVKMSNNEKRENQFLQGNNFSFEKQNQIIQQEQLRRSSQNFKECNSNTDIVMIENKNQELMNKLFQNDVSLPNKNQSIVITKQQDFQQLSIDMSTKHPQKFIQFNDVNDTTRSDPNDQFDPMQTLVSFSICTRCQNQIEGKLFQTNCLHNYHEECLEEMISEQILGQGSSKIICYCNKILHSKILYQLKNSNQIQYQLLQNQLNELKNKLKEKFIIQQCQNFNCNFFYMGTQIANSLCLNCDQ